MLARFVSQVVIILMKVSLRFIVMAFGVLSVIIHSVVQQQQLYVSSWGTTNTISSMDYQCKLFQYFLLGSFSASSFTVLVLLLSLYGSIVLDVAPVILAFLLVSLVLAVPVQLVLIIEMLL